MGCAVADFANLQLRTIAAALIKAQSQGLGALGEWPAPWLARLCRCLLVVGP